MKKFAAMLLALLMMALPFAGSAEEIASLLSGANPANYYQNAIDNGRRVTTKITVDGLPKGLAGDESIDQVIEDIVKALSIVYYADATEDMLSVNMLQADGTDASLLNIGAALVDGNELYIASNLLGGTFAVSADEAQTFIERMIDMLAMIGMFEEEEAAEIKAVVPQVLVYAGEYIEVIKTAMDMSNLDPSTLDYTALVEALNPILSKVQTAEVTMQPRNCDPAASVMTVSITEEDAKVFTLGLLKFLKANPSLLAVYEAEMAFMASVDPSYAQMGDFSSMLDTLIAELEKAQTSADSGTIDVAIWLDEMGIPVAGEIKLPEMNDYQMNYETYDYEQVTFTPAITFGRMTQNDGMALNLMMDLGGNDITVDALIKSNTVVVNFAMANSGVTMGNVRVEYTDRSALNLLAMDLVVEIDVNDEYQPMNIKFTCKEDVVLSGVDFTDDAVCSIAINGMQLANVNVNITTGDVESSIVEGNVVHPAQLSEADFSNWFVNAYNTLFSWVNTVPTMMPQSFLNLMMSDY